VLVKAHRESLQDNAIQQTSDCKSVGGQRTPYKPAVSKLKKPDDQFMFQLIVPVKGSCR
jgi:hypothetical protein